MRQIHPLFLFLATLLLAITLSATIIISGQINWEIGQEFGGPKLFMFGVNSGDVLAGFLLALGLSQLIWGPLFFTAYKEKAIFMMGLTGIMMLVCLVASAPAGFAWQNAHEDLGARNSAGRLSDWTAATQIIKTNNQAITTTRTANEVQADINALLGSTVTVRRKERGVNSLTKGCTRSHYAARSLCADVHTLRQELARAEAVAKRQEATLVAREQRHESLDIDMAKYYEIFGTLFSFKGDDLKHWRIGLVQLAMELSNNLIPIILLWLWSGSHSNHNHDNGARRGNPHDTPRHAPVSLRLLQGGLDKKEVLAHYVSETNPKGAQIPKDFLRGLNRWCDKHGFRRYQTRDVSRHIEPLGGYKCKEYINRSARTRWVFKRGVAA